MTKNSDKRDKATRKQLLRPAQLIVFALICALFAGGVTLFGMGFVQTERVEGQTERALIMALIVAGISFIVVLIVMALLLLAVDPKQIEQSVDRGVLVPDQPPAPSSQAIEAVSSETDPAKAAPETEEVSPDEANPETTNA